MKQQAIIVQCEQLIREIINGFAMIESKIPFEDLIMSSLKLQNASDWDKICSLLDLLGDTEGAKDNFEKFNLTGPTKYNDFGEMYLRLYGILNCIYLQKSAIIEFLTIIKLKDKKQLEFELNNCKILQIRHIAGAHTIDYYSNGLKISHQIDRSKLHDGIIKTLDSNGDFQEFNISELVIEFNKIASNVLIYALDKFISTVFKHSPKNKIRYIEKLNLIKLVNEGHWVINTDESSNPIII